MNNLSNKIYEYYVAHFTELPLDKQLHFASRLWLWRQDEKSRQLLDRLRPIIVPNDNLVTALQRIESGGLIPLHTGSPGLQAAREPYLLRYPALRMTSRLLYWASLLAAIYDLDARSALTQIYSVSELATLNAKLTNDHRALAVLSTHAVNFLYLYNRLVLEDEQFPSAQFWQDIVHEQAVTGDDDVTKQQLQLYLLTHAVIGESYFYQRAIPEKKINQYAQLIKEAETTLKANFTHASLDNKLEFLVCCRLTGYNPTLSANILTEAEAAVSADGDFLTDTRNANTPYALTSFDKSEHRSVLYIMATTPSEQVALLR